MSAHPGLFDRVIATGGDMNLIGEAKLACIPEQIGDDFVYAGDSKALSDDLCRCASPTPPKLAASQSVSYIEV
ncbi:hypothetical protein WT24_21210 [Burkholderia sp. MSMB1078WGS]|uniref:hypothetical protein n=1 Tax=Burkholderia sp. MSMB1078WGS TaxID=1637900 RepID=UPI00076C5D0A|nr:hypothetical protein [Burkholderia sp. MSMB1078WGS]KVT05370.1 hypothetical protein WT24_21210 [Burkholderia sp. MSMB1078WGS]